MIFTTFDSNTVSKKYYNDMVNDGWEPHYGVIIPTLRQLHSRNDCELLHGHRLYETSGSPNSDKVGEVYKK